MTIPKLFLFSLLFAAFFVFQPQPVSAKDEWIQVRSKNFYLIGNASEKEIRKVATKLEQFRETFRLVFGNITLTASTPTNVVVFKSDPSYKPFKPKRADGKIDNGVAGYFQPGEDVNYITLAAESENANNLGVIFHEYVHSIIETNFGKSEIPPWFNEGLAEYYQTFEIEEDQKVKLGLPQSDHLALLQQSQFIPLGTLFGVSNYALHQQASHSRNVFYAESWALIHYIVQTGKTDGLGKFIQLTIANKPAEQAFQEAFGIGYAQMEKDLRKYVSQATYKYHLLTFKLPLVFDSSMQVSPLNEAESNAYLGDLLYHVNRADDAEPFLRTALTLQPDLGMANASLGMVKIRQRKYDEAKGFLEKAIARDSKNYLALYRHAYLLSREGRDEFGYINKFDDESAKKIRDLLKKAIAANPGFIASYDLLAYVSLINNDELDDALKQIQIGIKHQPGNMGLLMRVAEIYLRQDKLKEAAALAEKLERTADDEEIRSRAANIASNIRQREEMLTKYEAAKKEYENARNSGSSGVQGERLLIRRRPGEDKPTQEEINKASAEMAMRSLNGALRQLQTGENRVLGRIAKIDCKGRVNYLIKTDSDTFQLASKDFSNLTVITYVPDAGDREIGCTSKLDTALAVISYRPEAASKPSLRGELVAIEFVPDNFRFIDLTTEAPPTFLVEETGPPPAEGPSAEERRSGMMDAIRERLRKPGEGERRELGFIEGSECSSRGAFFLVRVGLQTLKLTAPQNMLIGGYTPEVDNLQIGCGMKPIEIPAVVIFKVATDPKAKAAGDLTSLEFVPKSFTLN